jgi:deoxyribodipyrimidine photolyase-related protein
MTQKTLRLILGDQLNEKISSLSDCDKDNDIILMCEVWDETQYVRHHKKKIAFLFSAMRHFAKDLENNGYNIDYIKLSDETKSFKGEIEKAIKCHDITDVIVTEPSEYRVLDDMKSWADDLDVTLDIRPNDLFIATHDEFAQWAKDRKQLRMEYFYREMRKKTGLLIDGDGNPEGGEWNYDSENRETAKKFIKARPDLANQPESKTDKDFEINNKNNAIVQDVLKLVEDKFDDHFGDLHPFYFAVTRDQALDILDNFIANRLPHFGDYQDTMIEGEPWMYHSHLSFYINCGMLTPLEVCKAVENAYYDGRRNIPINAAEGFIRQVIGWREYIRGMYWLKMPEYKHENHLNAKRPLPDFFWNGKTDMNCLKQSITETKENAYAHHIQRLMVLGNFCLLMGAHPDEVNEWYLIVYADAYEWVELPNVTGMVLYADGGVVASKPYAAVSNYINKMSNYCDNCKYSPSVKTGEKACPFNYLYWNFLIENKDVLKGNPRMGMIYNTLKKMDDEKISTIKSNSKTFLDNI